jgi:hypothetical protein
MKTLFILFCSSLSFAFMTHQDFSQLPSHQKKAYLLLIQKLSVQAEQSFEATASFKYRLPHWFAFANSIEVFANESPGQLASDGICRISSASHLSDKELTNLVLHTLSCSEVVAKGQVSRFGPVVIERIEVLETELNRRSKNSTIQRGLKELEEVKQDIRSRGIIGGRTLPPSASGTRPLTPATQKSTAIAASVQPAKAIIEKKSELNLDQVLCLYAGHIVTKAVANKCQAQNQIADPELNSFFNFKCLPNEALCHPLVFGFISGCVSDSKGECTDRKPICVSKSKSASASCFEKSRKYKGIDHLVVILDKPELAASFDRYQRELKMVCEPQWIQNTRLSKRGRKDLSETCDKTFEATQSLLNAQKQRPDLKENPGQK